MCVDCGALPLDRDARLGLKRVSESRPGPDQSVAGPGFIFFQRMREVS